MENQKKRIKFNLFDVVVIVLILILAAAAYMILGASSDTTEANATIHYTVELTYLREEMADSVAVGDTFETTGDNYAVGTVTDVAVTAYTVQTVDEEDGVVRYEEVEGYINLQITLEVEVVETSDAFETVDGQEIRTGTSLKISNGTVYGSGYIIWTEREDAE